MYKYAKYMYGNVVELADKYQRLKKTKNKNTKITIEAGDPCAKSRPQHQQPNVSDRSSPKLKQLSDLLEKIADLDAFMNNDEDFDDESF